MGWYGYETTGSNETRTPICQVVLDLFDTSPGQAGVSLRMVSQAEASPSLVRTVRS